MRRLTAEEFMDRVRVGGECVPTDKNYKVYLRMGDVEDKFYFEDLSPQQQVEFIELLNANKVVIGYPGYFYNPPFFVTYVQPATP